MELGEVRAPTGLFILFSLPFFILGVFFLVFVTKAEHIMAFCGVRISHRRVAKDQPPSHDLVIPEV